MPRTEEWRFRFSEMNFKRDIMDTRRFFKAVWLSVLILAAIIAVSIALIYMVTILPLWLWLTVYGTALFIFVVFMTYKTM